MFSSSKYFENRPLLPYTDELYLVSFWKHSFITKSTNVRDWFIMNKITEIINNCDNPYFDSIFPDDIEIIKDEDGLGYEVFVPDPESYNNGKQKGFRFVVKDEDELDCDVNEYIKENICNFNPSMIFNNIRINKRVKETLYNHYGEVETRNQPEKAYDTINCCVCFEDYEDKNEETEFDDTTKCKKIASCGHTLCYGCWYHIIRSDNSICPHCREPWDEGYDIDENNDDYEDIYYTLEDIQALCEDGDNDTLNDIINLPDLVRDVINADGYADILGYDDCDSYNWELPPLKYRELGGITDDVYVLVGEL